MCAHYESCKNPEKLKQHFGIDTVPEAAKSDLWPGYLGLFIRRNQPEDASSVPSSLYRIIYVIEQYKGIYCTNTIDYSSAIKLRIVI